MFGEYLSNSYPVLQPEQNLLMYISKVIPTVLRNAHPREMLGYTSLNSSQVPNLLVYYYEYIRGLSQDVYGFQIQVISISIRQILDIPGYSKMSTLFIDPRSEWFTVLRTSQGIPGCSKMSMCLTQIPGLSGLVSPWSILGVSQDVRRHLHLSQIPGLSVPVSPWDILGVSHDVQRCLHYSYIPGPSGPVYSSAMVGYVLRCLHFPGSNGPICPWDILGYPRMS